MDELDRMFRRLVHNIRAGYPDLLARPFEVSALHQNLIPYRLNRRELDIDSAEEYEIALMKLLSGARGLLNGDPDMQAALSAELESPNPDLSVFRAWGTASVSINPTAIRAMDSQSPPMVRVPVSPSPTRQAEMAGRATLEVPASGASPVATRVATPPAPRVTSPVAKPATTPVPVEAPCVPTAGCRYCAGELPEGRETHFCPHCGQNLTVKQCPACCTELEVEWQFCITCGRQSE